MRIPGIGEEEFGRHFHRLQVAHVNDPEPVRTVLVGQVHLLPDLGDLGHVQPFIRARPAHVIEVVVDAGAAAALAFFRRGQAADVTPVVVAPEQQHVIRHAHTLLVVFLDFLVERPQLGHRGRVLAQLLLDERALVAHDALQQVDVGAFRHRLVAVAAHRHRDHLLVVARVAQALGPERAQGVGVAAVVPRTLAVADPLLVGAHHRLVVRGAHHDAHGVGQLAVALVVVVEGRAPHGGPQVVGAHAQHQFEQLLVELAVVAAEALPGPVGERRRFVVQEDAAVLDHRLVHQARIHRDAQGGMARHRHVGPPVPGRDADLFRQRVDAVNGAALVAAGDDQGALHAGQRVRHRLDEKTFPLARQRARIDPALPGQFIDEGVAAEGADDDYVAPRCAGLPFGRLARHLLDVALQVTRCAQHAGEVVLAHHDRGGAALGNEVDAILALHVDETRGTERVHLGRQRQAQAERQAAQQPPHDACSDPAAGPRWCCHVSSDCYRQQQMLAQSSESIIVRARSQTKAGLTKKAGAACAGRPL